MKRFAVIMFVLFGNCLGMMTVLDNDEQSDNESIGYSDEQELRINRERRIIISRIRRLQGKAIHCLKTIPRPMSLLSPSLSPADRIIMAKYNRCEKLLSTCSELEEDLRLSVWDYRNFLISLEELFDEFSVVSSEVTMLLLSAI